MYKIYTNKELVAVAPSSRVARSVAISKYKELNEEVFVWREKKGEKSTLVLEVLHD